MAANWRVQLDALKREAYAKRKNEVTELRGQMKRGVDAYRYTPTAAEITQINSHQAVCTTKGLLVVLSCGDMDGVGMWWWLSMSPRPAGRKLTDKDRRWMETFRTYLGAPEEPDLRDRLPHHVFHWGWPVTDRVLN